MKEKRPNSGHKSREAYLAYHKAWREKNKDHVIAWRKKYRGPRGTSHRKDRYGVTGEDYARMLAEQGGGCAICRRQHGEGRKECLRVDHDHETGHVRGLLCHRCNSGIG